MDSTNLWHKMNGSHLRRTILSLPSISMIQPQRSWTHCQFLLSQIKLRSTIIGKKQQSDSLTSSGSILNAGSSMKQLTLSN